MIRHRTQNIILLFLLLVLLITSSITYLAFRINDRKKNIFIQSNQRQIEKSVNIAKSLEFKRIQQIVFEYSIWDDMVRFVQSKSSSWAKINADPIIKTYSTDVIWTFDTTGLKTYCKTRDTYPQLKDYKFESFIFDSLKNTKVINYYIETPYGVLEIFGATIHPSSDRDRLTKPRGFFLIGKFIDNNFLQDLSAITGTQISYTGDTLQSNHELVSINIPLTMLDSNVVKYLHVEKRLDFLQQYDNFSLQLIILYSISALTIFISFIIFTLRWINRPLRIVENALVSESPQNIEELNKLGG